MSDDYLLAELAWQEREEMVLRLREMGLTDNEMAEFLRLPPEKVRELGERALNRRAGRTGRTWNPFRLFR